MINRSQSRKFMRSPRVYSPSSCSVLPSTISVSKQSMSPALQDSSQYSYDNIQEMSKKPSFRTQYILGKLSQLQKTVQQQKDFRTSEHNKIMKLIKQMSCKHTSIIYDTEIKYLKSCLSVQNLSDGPKIQRQKQDESQAKKSLNYSNNQISIRNQRPNIPKKPNRNNITQRPTTINQRQKMLKNSSVKLIINKINDYSFDKNSSNYQKNQPSPEIDIQKITQNILANIQSSINEKLTRSQQKITQQINQMISNRIPQTQQPHRPIQAVQKNQLSSLIQAQQQLQRNVHLIRQNTNQIIQNLTKEVLNTENKVKNNISLLASQFNEKIQHLSSSSDTDIYKSKIQSLTKTVSQLSDKLKNSTHFFESGFNITSKKLQQVQNFITLKLQQNKKCIDRLQKLQNQRFMQTQAEKKYNKSLQMEKQKIKQHMFKNIQESIITRTENVRMECSQKMQANYMRLQDQILGIVERHIIYIQNFIKKIQATQDLINKKYLSQQQIIRSQQLIQPAMDTSEIQLLIDLRSDQLFKIMKEDFQYLNNRSTELQSTLQGVIQALNQVVNKVKVIG